MTDTISRQKTFLLETIQEAKQAEIKRLKRLHNVKSFDEKTNLLIRYERERKNDQTKIDNLTNELLLLKDKISSGEFQATIKLTPPKDDKLHSENRFYGLETLQQMGFYEDVCNNFQRHDEKHQRQIEKSHYDPIAEVRKFRLLTEKRQVLQQLIDIQSRTSQGRNHPTPSYHHRYDNSSDIQSKTESDYSYATFHSSNRSNSSYIPLKPKQIPKLDLIK